MSAQRPSQTTNFLLTGVGGQGILLAADVVALVGLAQGLEVKKSEVHGMAQRGGSVTSEVRWGAQVHSPLIPAGEVDYLIALERLEALRYLSLLRPGGTVLVNDYCIMPVAVSAGNDLYPPAEQQAKALAGAAGRWFLVPANTLAQELGNARINNVILLGALAALLDVPEALWLEVIAQRVPQRFVALNQQAFAAGRAFLAQRLMG